MMMLCLCLQRVTVSRWALLIMTRRRATQTVASVDADSTSPDDAVTNALPDPMDS